MNFTLSDFKQGLDELYKDLCNPLRNSNNETQELILDTILFYRKKIKSMEAAQ